MSGKWPGGFIKKTAPTIVGPVNDEGGSASGVWTLDQVADYEQRGLWPQPIFGRGLYAWGENDAGQLGVSDTTNYSSPVQVGRLLLGRNPLLGVNIPYAPPLAASSTLGGTTVTVN